jgi:hypothetical protein
LMRLQEGAHSVDRPFLQLRGLSPGVDRYLGVRRQRGDIYAGLVRVRRGIVRHDQRRGQAGPREVARDTLYSVFEPRRQLPGLHLNADAGVLGRCCLPRDGFTRHGTTSIEVCPLCRADTQEVSTRQSPATFCVLAGRSLYFAGCHAIQRVALHKNSREILAMSRNQISHTISS